MRENRPSGSEGGVALIPPSLPLSCAARVRRHHAESRQRMECGGLPPLCEAGQGETWPSHWGGSRLGNGILAPRVEAEVLSARAARGPLRTGNSGRAGWFSFGSPSSGGTIGVRNGGSEGLGRGTVDASCAQDPCPFQRTAQFWARAMEEALLGLETLWCTERWRLLCPHSRPAKGSKN
jgi:hypothetical protein